MHETFETLRDRSDNLTFTACAAISTCVVECDAGALLNRSFCSDIAIWDQKQHSYALITATNGLCGFWSIGILDRSIIEHLLTQRTFAFIGGCVLCRFPLASSLGFTIVTERMRAVWQNCAHKLRPRQGHLALLLLLPRGACRVNVTAKATI